MDLTQQSPVILSFCPGIRGIERGLERIFQSVRVAAFLEIETFIVENLLAAMEEGLVAPAPIWSNLKTFNPHPFRGCIDGIIGGYPCQGFSVAGLRKGQDDPRHLWPFIRRHIEVIQPRWCYFENVAGHLTLGFDVVKRELEEMGYHVEAGIYTAEEVGAPHRRERLFILAIMVDTTSDGGAGDIRDLLEENAGESRPEKQHENQPGQSEHAGSNAYELGNPENPFGRSASDRSHGSGERESCAGGFEASSSNVGHPYNSQSPSETGNLREMLGVQEIKRPNLSASVLGRAGDELADPNNRLEGAQNGQSPAEGSHRDQAEQNEFQQSERCSGGGADEELAHSGLQRPPERQESATGIEQFGETMADTSDTGLQGRKRNGSFQQQGETSRGSATERSSFKFPAGQGTFQYDYEEPRTIESSLEYTINGYNFTEDLHRAIGNSVVEQTAELAFRDLLRKTYEKFELVGG